MFTNRVDLEIWEYNTCKHCKAHKGCPILAELYERGAAPEVEKVGLGWECHSLERNDKWRTLIESLPRSTRT